MCDVVIENSLDAIDKLYIAGLFDANWYEADARAEAKGLQVNLETAYAMVEAGVMTVIIAYDEDTPVGYLIYALTTRDLFTSSPIAETISTYLLPEYRKTKVFRQMLTLAETYANRVNGVEKFYMAVPVNSIDLSKHGYKLENLTYGKEVQCQQ